MKKFLSCILMALMILVSVPIYAEDQVISNEGQAIVELTASIESTYTISLPKQVDVTDEETTFNIKVKGDITADETINIDIPDSATLSEDGSERSISLTINDNGGISYVYTDMNKDDYEGINAKRDITITHDPITAGTWKTDITINISLDKIVMKEAYLSERTILDQKLPNYANATSILFDTEPVPSDKLSSAVLVSTEDSPNEIYAYYTDAEKTSLVFAPKDKNTTIYAPANSSKLFRNLGSVESINLSNFDTLNITDTSYMFNNCTSLATLDLSGWNASQVTNMYNMFFSCSALTSVGDLTNWDVSKVTNMDSMFYYCEALRSAGNLENWNVSNVEYMSNMFEGSAISPVPSWYQG